MALYTQSHQPPGVEGDVWVDTGTGNFKVMSIGGWVTLFNFNMENGGLTPLSGGKMTGAILGAHGLLNTNSPRMTGIPTLDANDLCTIDVMRDYIKAQIELAMPTGVIAAPPPTGTGPVSKRQTISFGCGKYNPPPFLYPYSVPITIPTTKGEWPYFLEEDGSYTRATAAQCQHIIVGPTYWATPLMKDGSCSYDCQVINSGNIIVRMYLTIEGNPNNAALGFSWLIVAVRT